LIVAIAQDFSNKKAAASAAAIQSKTSGFCHKNEPEFIYIGAQEEGLKGS